jgi:DNA-binding transcriptional ArsR family regulator
MSKTKTSRTKRTRIKDEGASVDPRLMKALSHPLRQRILQALNQRVASPAELSEELGESLGNVSYHVKILNELEAIELVRTAPVRGALEHFYRPLVRSQFDDTHWAQLPASIRRDLFGQTLQQIWDHLADAAEEEKLDGDGESVVWIDLQLDEQGLADLNTAVSEALDRAMEIQSESLGRLADLSDEEREEQSHRTELAMLHFHRAAKTRVTASKPRKKRAGK